MNNFIDKNKDKFVQIIIFLAVLFFLGLIINDIDSESSILKEIFFIIVSVPFVLWNVVSWFFSLNVVKWIGIIAIVYIFLIKPIENMAQKLKELENRILFLESRRGDSEIINEDDFDLDLDLDLNEEKLI